MLKFRSVVVSAIAAVMVLGLGGCKNPPNVPDALLILSSVPVLNEIDVPVNAAISVTFGTDLDSGTVNAASLKLVRKGTATAVAGNVAVSNQTLVFTPTALLDYDTEYQLTITTDVMDLDGGSLENPATLEFTTISTLGPSEMVYVMGSDGVLRSFRNTRPGTILSSVSVTGLAAGETILGIDFRPATGLLYGMGSVNGLYKIDLDTGVALQVSLDPLVVVGLSFGFDFNPLVDRARLVSDADENKRYNPINGAFVATDTSLFYVAGDPAVGFNPRITGVAYDGWMGSTAATVFAIDSDRDALVRLGGINGIPSANSGPLTTIGSLGFNTSELVGFDISATTSNAYASMTNLGASVSKFFVVNLATGAATLIGDIGGGSTIIGMTVAPPAAE